MKKKFLSAWLDVSISKNKRLQELFTGKIRVAFILWLSVSLLSQCVLVWRAGVQTILN